MSPDEDARLWGQPHSERFAEIAKANERADAAVDDYNDALAATDRLTFALSDARMEIATLRDALAWYGENARLCRLIHSDGDVGRDALANDGGRRAKDALAKAKQP